MYNKDNKNNKNITLKDLPVGKSCSIVSVSDEITAKKRLEELGFEKGAYVDKLNTGFSGSPIACRVCGAVIAIRANDSKRIFVYAKNSD
ncbi:MAG: ferrous iron transport protein A [Clostridia bacterium]|nr:ferrous iron transport protein A [Clostridia bacterium]